MSGNRKIWPNEKAVLANQRRHQHMLKYFNYSNLHGAPLKPLLLKAALNGDLIGKAALVTKRRQLIFLCEAR